MATQSTPTWKPGTERFHTAYRDVNNSSNITCVMEARDLQGQTVLLQTHIPEDRFLKALQESSQAEIINNRVSADVMEEERQRSRQGNKAAA
jgi:hypothetical protein